jgi:hypothetical protein
MSIARPFDAARHDRAAQPRRLAAASHPFSALPRADAWARLPAKPRLNTLDPSLWWVHALRRTVWRWQRRRSPRTAATLVWC